MLPRGLTFVSYFSRNGMWLRHLTLTTWQRRSSGNRENTMPQKTSALVVAKDNGYGLTMDAALVGETLEEIGFAVEFARQGTRGLLERLRKKADYDVAFHIERAFPEWRNAARKNVLIPNQERFPRRHIGRLRSMDAVLTKTAHAQSIFSALGAPVLPVGFSSRDLYDASVAKDWRGFLHVAGGSTVKGTEDIVALWARHPEWPELLLVQKEKKLPADMPPNVRTLQGFLAEDELRALMNRCGIHLCPSRSEGWGHYIHEALGCGAVVITTDAPPMNEFVDPRVGFLVPAGRQQPRHLGTDYFIDPAALEAAITTALETDPDLLAARGQDARQHFLANRNAFAERLSNALAQIIVECPASDAGRQVGSLQESSKAT
ncbi:glycosyltransferase family 4 protein [Oricola sp.]|uniref:glycosyltransferase family 4 protein n=1 Tax=Oricola sp. TaxID=1979950 RepID=UPI0025E163A0|nr:glycosyltransferase family 4 protein [Oricola sp.]MCI5078381.1 glycosyltransferase family 4 protein [Oricola sp.]